MIDVSKAILTHFQVRKTEAQKLAFLNFMKQNYPQAVIEEGGFPHNRNLVIGDVKTAKVIMGAHYDTAPALPFPNFLTPRNIPVYILFNLLLVCVIGGITFLLASLPYRYIESRALARLLGYAVPLGLYYILFHSRANPHTANDNTSGVITLCEIMSRLSEQELASTAFVFFDNEEIGLRGSSFFRKKYKGILASKLFINFDCVSDGDYFLMIQNKAAQAQYSNALQSSFPSTEEKEVLFAPSSSTIYPSDQKGFPVHIAVAAFRKGKRIGLYVSRIHTPRDTIFDTRNIDYLSERTSHFLRTIIE